MLRQRVFLEIHYEVWIIISFKRYPFFAITGSRMQLTIRVGGLRIYETASEAIKLILQLAGQPSTFPFGFPVALAPDWQWQCCN